MKRGSLYRSTGHNINGPNINASQINCSINTSTKDGWCIEQHTNKYVPQTVDAYTERKKRLLSVETLLETNPLTRAFSLSLFSLSETGEKISQTKPHTYSTAGDFYLWVLPLWKRSGELAQSSHSILLSVAVVQLTACRNMASWPSE